MSISFNSPYIEQGNFERNSETYINLIEKSASYLNVFPESSINGFNCGELFFNNNYLNYAEKILVKIHEFCKQKIKITILGALHNFGAIAGLSRMIFRADIELCNSQDYYEDRWIKTWMAINQERTNNKKFEFDFSHRSCLKVLSDLINPF